MLTLTIQNYLDRNHVHFQQIEHPLAFTAQRTAASAHIPGRKMCKTVVVKVDGTLTMVVLHADERINLERLRESLDASTVSMVSEREFEERFPDCEIGAMPPFGELFSMSVIASESVASEEKVIFNAGTHTDLLVINYSDFYRLVKPIVGTFTSH